MTDMKPGATTSTDGSGWQRLAVGFGIAAVLWFGMFSPWTHGLANFWVEMTFSAAILVGLAWFLGREERARFRLTPTEALLGVASAAVLWGVFWVGNYVSTRIFNFAAQQVSSIYQMRDGSSYVVLALLLICLIGPAEEIFWRGFVLEHLLRRHSWPVAVIAGTAMYALVHIWSFNFMLVAAAAVCGLFWSLMYVWRRNLATVIISHALWDTAVFLIFPIH